MKWVGYRRGKHPRGRTLVGDWVLFVKELRNLAHAGKHVRNYPKIKLNSRHYSDARTVFQAAMGLLADINAKDLLAKAGRRSATK